MNDLQQKFTKFPEKLKDATSIEQLTGKDGLITDLFKDTIQNLLEAELTNHLGYPKHKKFLSPRTTNKRNGSYPKKIKTGSGETELDIPMDRHGEFEPRIIPKQQTTTTDLDQKIISMDAIHFKVRQDGVVKTVAAYLVLAISTEGKKDLLGIWIGEEEGAKFWLSVLTDLQNRGVKDIRKQLFKNA